MLQYAHSQISWLHLPHLLSSTTAARNWQTTSGVVKFVMFGCITTGSLCAIVSVLSCVAACCISVADCQK